MKAFDQSITLYEQAIKSFPQHYTLHLDYGRVLFTLGKVSEARKQLIIYRQFDSVNAEARIMTAYLNLWTGKTGQAGNEAKSLLTQYPGNAEAKDIINTIGQWTVPYMKAGTQFLSDDQPLKGQTYYAEAGVYKSWLFAPKINASIYRYNVEDRSFQSSWVQLSNSFQIGTKSNVKLRGGIFGQNSKQSEFSGGAEVSRQLARHFTLQAALDRRPYQFTISSVENVVMENVTALGLNYNRNNKWFGKLGYEMYRYEDENKINVAYLWILAPVYATSKFSLSGGYAFRYADANATTFVSKKSMSEVVNNWPPVNGIDGIYYPYFSPENQLAHSVLVSIKVSPTKNLLFNSSANIAFSAKADNPYLYVDAHDSGLFFNSGFARIDYTPISWTNELTLSVLKKLFVTAAYNYDKLLYYKGNRGSIELKYLFAK
jgi:hypothetical protein